MAWAVLFIVSMCIFSDFSKYPAANTKEGNHCLLVAPIADTQGTYEVALKG